MTGRPDIDIVNAIQRYHQKTNGWADIGYHYLIGVDGRVYEGRTVAAQGAHVGGAKNRHNLGVSMIGDFEISEPNPVQLTTLRRFMGTMQQRYRIPNSQVFGHRDFGITVCPGKNLYQWLSAYKRGSV